MVEISVRSQETHCGNKHPHKHRKVCRLKSVSHERGRKWQGEIRLGDCTHGIGNLITRHGNILPMSAIRHCVCVTERGRMGDRTGKWMESPSDMIND